MAHQMAGPGAKSDLAPYSRGGGVVGLGDLLSGRAGALHAVLVVARLHHAAVLAGTLRPSAGERGRGDNTCYLL